MFFSVIVPVYKIREFLPACVESVLSQSFPDFELILVDDGSPDDCGAICDAYAKKDGRVRVIHKENGGLASARQAGIREAQGNYVYNLDGDDAILPHTLEEAKRIIEETNCQIVSFAYCWVKNGETIKITNDNLPEGLYGREEIEKKLFPSLLMNDKMEHVAPYLAGKAVKRELLLPHQLAVNPKISLGEDLVCVFPMYLAAESVYISKKETYLYSVRTDSLSKAFNVSQFDKIENVMAELLGAKGEKPEDFEAQMGRYMAFMFFALLAAAAEGGYFESLKEIKKKIIKGAHFKTIKSATFGKITLKSRIGIFLMKRKCIAICFCFLYLCGLLKRILKKG